MLLWILLLIIFAAGAIGGIVNAIMTDNAFVLPKAEITQEKSKIYRPGILGNIIISGVAACVSWGLYGPFGAIYIAGGQITKYDAGTRPGITLAAFVGAILVGVAGARWFTNEVDKNLLRSAASQAAGLKQNVDLSSQIALLKPVEALRLVRRAAKSE
jgi:hypothetical protein